MSVGSGAISSSLDASTPVSALVVGGKEVKVGSFKFTTSHDSYTIYELYTSLNATTASKVVGEVVWKDGATEIGRSHFDEVRLESQTLGLEVPIPANSTKVLDAYLQLGAVGTPGAGPTGEEVTLTLSGFWAQNTNGDVVEDDNAVDANPTYVYKTKPTISNVALPSTTLIAGSQTVAKFTVSADSAGTIAWRVLKLSVSTSSPSGTLTLSNYAIYDSANESTALANVTVTASSSGATVVFTSSQDQEVSGTKTYVVKADVAGTGIISGASVSHRIATGQSSYSAPDVYASVAGGSSFVWSDESVTPHSATAASWNGDYLVKNIPTDSQTLTK
jgi:hypothetical protein